MTNTVVEHELILDNQAGAIEDSNNRLKTAQQGGNATTKTLTTLRKLIEGERTRIDEVFANFHTLVQTSSDTATHVQCESALLRDIVVSLRSKQLNLPALHKLRA
jgi:hypothetical protein